MKIFFALCVTTLFLCTVKSHHSWWQSMSLYQIYPRSFMDSDGDGNGDLRGIINKLDYLADLKVDALWLTPIYKSSMVDNGYDASNFTGINYMFGTMQDFESLVKRTHDYSMKVLMDCIPTYSSDQHEWFQKSVAGDEPYTDYYVWKEGKKDDGTMQPPNNWRSVFNGSAWTWNDKRQAFYLHQFTPSQPDLNYRNKDLVEEMKDILRFWMKKGVDGFRIDATPYLVENQNLNYEMMQQWRDVVDEYAKKVDQVSRVLMVEDYANISTIMKYYSSGINFPFNFGLMDINNLSTATDVKNILDSCILKMPNGATANWVVGNHDNPRLVSRIGIHRATAVTALALLLPAVAVTYYGDEIGMPDAPIFSKAPSKFTDPERSPMQWNNSTSAGFSTNIKTWRPVNPNYKTLNLAFAKVSDDSYYNYYKALASLRNMHAVRSGNLQVKVLENDVLAFSRNKKKKNSVYVLINFSEQNKTVNLMEFENTDPELAFYRASPGLGLTSGSLMNANEINIPPTATMVFVDS
ncbi:alpha-glucosidase-like [Belonocnema kinseyi]|uniref:alpha-glucosidase-like n=1 Tax=Belonocnema kinseyi TaxID=2817044 RepID=UPI00143D41A1|nr:alpha-glucosidase-like [Belonocnema kinseyi]